MARNGPRQVSTWLDRQADAVMIAVAVLAAGLLVNHPGLAQQADADAEQPIANITVDLGRPVDFEKDVLPILEEHCFACHNVAAAEGELILENYESLVKGGKSGPVVLPGDSGQSRLIQLASREHKPAMPPIPNQMLAEPLQPEELAILRLWIDQGALGPQGTTPPPPAIDWRSLPKGVNPIYAADLTPDGQYAAAGWANQIYVYHVPSGRLEARLTDPGLQQLNIYKGQPGVAHLDLVQSLAFSPDGMLLASGGYRVAKLWRRPDEGRSVQVLAGSLDAISAVAVSPDGQWLAAGGPDRVVRVWERASGQLLYTLEGHTDRVTSVAFSPDSQRLLSAGADGTVRVWDMATGAALGQVETPSPIASLAISPAGDRFITGHDDSALRLWNVPTRPLRVLAAAAAPFGVMAVSPDRKYLALGGGGDARIHLIDLKTGQHRPALEGHTDGVASLAWSADGSRLVSAAGDRTIRVWDASAGRTERVFTGNSEPAGALAVSSDGRRILSGHGDGLLKLWQLDVPGPRLVAGENGAIASALAVSPDGKLLATAGAERGVPAIHLWDLGSGARVRSLFGHAGEITQIRFSRDGSKIVSASVDRTVRVWNVADGSLLSAFGGHGAAVTAVAPGSDATRVLSGAANNTLKLSSASDGSEIKNLAGHTGPISALAITPDGSRAISSSADQTIRIWDLGSGDAIHEINHGAAVTAMALSGDGTKLVTSAADNSVKLWSASDGSPLMTLSVHAAPIQAVAFSPDNEWVLSAAADNQLILWHTPTGKMLQSLSSGSSPLVTATYGPARDQWIVATEDKSVRLLTPNVVQTLPTHGGAVSRLTYLPGDHRALSSSADGAVRLIDVQQASVVWEAQYGAAVLGAALSPDGQVVASAGADNLIKLWNATNGRALPSGTLQGHSGPVHDIAYTADGDRLVSTSADKQVLVWDASGGVVQKFGVHGDAVLAAAVVGDTVVSSSADGTVRQWPLVGLRRVGGHAGPVTSVAFFPDGQKIVSVSKDHTARIWSLADGQEIRSVNHGAEIDAVAVSPDGQRFVTAGADNLARLWNAADGQKIADLTGHAAPVLSVAYSPSGAEIVTGSADESIRAWDGTNGAVGKTVAAHAAPVQAVGFTPDSTRIVTAGADHQVRLWDLHQPWVLVGHIGLPESSGDMTHVEGSSLSERVVSLAFSPDGTRLATGSGEPSRSGEIKIWSVADRSLVLEIPDPHTDAVFGLDFSPDGRYLASAAADKFVKVWDAQSGQFVKSFEGHTNHVLGVSWRGDGQQLASCGAVGGSVGGIPGEIKIWNFPTGEQIRTIALSKQVTAITYVGASSTIASSCGDRSARLHNADNGGQLRAFGGSGDFLYTVSVTPDGKLIAAAGQDSVLRVWDATNGQLIHAFPPPPAASSQVARQPN